MDQEPRPPRPSNAHTTMADRRSCWGRTSPVPPTIRQAAPTMSVALPGFSAEESFRPGDRDPGAEASRRQANQDPRTPRRKRLRRRRVQWRMFTGWKKKARIDLLPFTPLMDAP
ncbi:hypothetical protein VTO42DRAFT_4588 [Malbranchea cinnamomea]